MPRRGPCLRRHHPQLHTAQIETGVLHVDECSVETGMADDFDDLRIGNAANVGAQCQAAFADDFLDAIALHDRVARYESCQKGSANPP